MTVKHTGNKTECYDRLVFCFVKFRTHISDIIPIILAFGCIVSAFHVNSNQMNSSLHEVDTSCYKFTCTVFVFLLLNDTPLTEDNVPQVYGSASQYRFPLQYFNTLIRGQDEGIGKRRRRRSVCVCEGLTKYLRKVFADL